MTSCKIYVKTKCFSKLIGWESITIVAKKNLFVLIHSSSVFLAVETLKQLIITQCNSIREHVFPGWHPTRVYQAGALCL